MILYDLVSPCTLMIPILWQWCLPLLPTSPPNYESNIDATVVRYLPPPTNISWPTDFWKFLLPVDPLKIMTAKLGIFDITSVSSLFVDFSQIALHLTSLFSPCSSRQDDYYRPRLQYCIFVPSGGTTLSPPPPWILQVQGGAYFFATSPQR